MASSIDATVRTCCLTDVKGTFRSTLPYETFSYIYYLFMRLKGVGS